MLDETTSRIGSEPLWPFSLRWSNRVKLAALTGGCLCAGAFFYLVNPATASVYPFCPFYALTGLYCPGCGTARGLHSLLHGNLEAAVGYNPLMVAALPFLLYGFVSYAAVALGGRSLPQLFTGMRSGLVLLGIILLYWVTRNVPVYPFTLLAP